MTYLRLRMNVLLLVVVVVYTLLNLNWHCSGSSDSSGNTNSNRSSHKTSIRILFGSCVVPTLEQPLWQPILDRNPDLFIFTGDATYLDYEALMPSFVNPFNTWIYAYQLLLRSSPDIPDPSTYAHTWAITYANQSAFHELREMCPVIGIYDDHDFGYDNAIADNPHKVIAKQLYKEFLDSNWNAFETKHNHNHNHNHNDNHNENPNTKHTKHTENTIKNIYSSHYLPIEFPNNNENNDEQGLYYHYPFTHVIDDDAVDDTDNGGKQHHTRRRRITIDVIVLDIHYSANKETGDILGQEQWLWFEDVLEDIRFRTSAANANTNADPDSKNGKKDKYSYFDDDDDDDNNGDGAGDAEDRQARIARSQSNLILIVSGQQFLPFHRQKLTRQIWNGYYRDSHAKLLSLLTPFLIRNDNQVLFLTGDVHWSEILTARCIGGGTRDAFTIKEVTSSSMTFGVAGTKQATYSSQYVYDAYFKHDNDFLAECRFTERNFGELEIVWDSSKPSSASAAVSSDSDSDVDVGVDGSADIKIKNIYLRIIDENGDIQCQKILNYQSLGHLYDEQQSRGHPPSSIMDQLFIAHGHPLYEYQDESGHTFKCYSVNGGAFRTEEDIASFEWAGMRTIYGIIALPIILLAIAFCICGLCFCCRGSSGSKRKKRAKKTKTK